MSAIAENIKETQGKVGSPAQWAERHLHAWHNPDGVEVGLKGMIVGLAHYGAQVRREFGRPLGEDNFLGPAFKDIAESIITLLNGDFGRFDGGTLDALVRAIAVENGIELE